MERSAIRGRATHCDLPGLRCAPSGLRSFHKNQTSSWGARQRRASRRMAATAPPIPVFNPTRRALIRGPRARTPG